MTISEGIVIEAAGALAKAGALGLSFVELAKALWPDAGVRAHGAVGGVVRELEKRGLAAVTPGGKRRRVALTKEGREWVASGSLIEDSAEVARLLGEEREPPNLDELEELEPPASPAPRPVPAVIDPVEAAIQAFCERGPAAELPPGTSRQEAYLRGRSAGAIGVRAKIARLRAACPDQRTFLIALEEAERRTRARFAQHEASMRADGLDPDAYDRPAYG